MKVTIEVVCDNAAFGLQPEYELMHILRKYAVEVEINGISDDRLRDSNGNEVGYVKVTQ